MKKYNLNHAGEFPIYGLPPTVQAAINEVTAARQCARDYAAAAAITAIAAAIGSRAKVTADYDNRLNLYVGVVGESAQNKSTPAKDLLSPIEKIHSELMKEYKEKKSIYATLLATRGKGSNGMAENVPQPKQLYLADATPEARYQVLATNPRGILQYCDELKSMIDNIGRYTKSGEASDLLSIYDGRSITINRKADGCTYIEKPFMSIFGTIQPGVLKSTFAKNGYFDNGLVPRFMWFYPEIHPYRDFNKSRKPDSAVMQKWSDYITYIYKTVESENSETPPEITIRVGNDAMGIFNEYRNETGNYYAGYESTIAGKSHIFVLKLAGIAALSRNAEYEYNIAPTISTEDILWAIQCAYYFRHTALMVLKDCDAMSNPSRRGNEAIIREIFKAYPNAKAAKLAESLGVTRQFISKCNAKTPSRDEQSTDERDTQN